MPDIFYVYVLYRDEALTRPFYVGKGKGRRYKEHAYDSVRKYGTNKRKNYIVNKCLQEFGYIPYKIEYHNLSEDAAFAMERALIVLYGRLDKKTGCLANATDGGDGTSGHVRTPEIIKSVAQKTTGLKRSPEFCAAITARLKGVKHSAERVENNRRGHLGQRWSAEQREKRVGKALPWLHTAEVRAKISRALTGKRASIETREKQRQAALRRDPMTRKRPPPSAETRAKISATKQAQAQARALVATLGAEAGA